MPGREEKQNELEIAVEELRRRLAEAEDALRVIEQGEVNAVVLWRGTDAEIAFLKNGHSEHMQNVSEIEQDFKNDGPPVATVCWGKSRAVKNVRKLIELAAQKDTPVLLQGETGTGKGAFARWIYENSPRSAQPFVEINCSSLKGDLLSNELFGHIRGAYTSASETRPGLLDLADGGTLFLDEIGEMDLPVQSQFLKVLEEKRYRRLGDVQERQSEFRLICATSCQLEEEVRQGRFRNDLYFRIHVFPLEIPPLRDRTEDIPGLVQHFLETWGARHVKVSSSAHYFLKTHSWPGNIRELRNALERALLLSDGEQLTPDHFPGLLAGHVQDFPHPRSEKDRIQLVLQRFGGNKKRAAEFLQISRATLYRKLASFSE